MSMLIIPSLQQAQSKGSVKHTHYGMALDCNWRYFKWLQSNHARGIAEVKVWGSLQQAPGMCHLGETQSCSVFSYRHSEQFWLRKTVNTSSRKISYSHLYTYISFILIHILISPDLREDENGKLIYMSHSLPNMLFITIIFIHFWSFLTFVSNSVSDFSILY